MRYSVIVTYSRHLMVAIFTARLWLIIKATPRILELNLNGIGYNSLYQELFRNILALIIKGSC